MEDVWDYPQHLEVGLPELSQQWPVSIGYLMWGVAERKLPGIRGLSIKSPAVVNKTRIVCATM